MIELVQDPIDVNALLRLDDEGGSGGLVLFLGTVRNQTGGRPVTRLDYEAYDAMALSEMKAVAAAAEEQFDIERVDIVHRVGTLAHGEVAVAIAVRAAHRPAAFDACRFAIDTLKQTVPIWKKEYFEDGETWVGDRP